MNHITVKLDDLFSIVSEMKQDGVSIANLCITETDNPADDVPAFLVLSAPDPNNPNSEIEYDYVDAVSES